MAGQEKYEHEVCRQLGSNGSVWGRWHPVIFCQDLWCWKVVDSVRGPITSDPADLTWISSIRSCFKLFWNSSVCTNKSGTILIYTNVFHLFYSNCPLWVELKQRLQWVVTSSVLSCPHRWNKYGGPYELQVRSDTACWLFGLSTIPKCLLESH